MPRRSSRSAWASSVAVLVAEVGDDDDERALALALEQQPRAPAT